MDPEKEHHETVEDVKSTLSVPEIDRAAEKRLLWKLDIHVVPILMFLFLLAFLDRINIGNARLQGLEKDLGMAGHDYNIALFIFFIPYILFEVPSNLVLRKVPPSWWLSGIMFFWGISPIQGSDVGDCADFYRHCHRLPRGDEELRWSRRVPFLVRLVRSWVHAWYVMVFLLDQRPH